MQMAVVAMPPQLQDRTPSASSIEVEDAVLPTFAKNDNRLDISRRPDAEDDNDESDDCIKVVARRPDAEDDDDKSDDGIKVLSEPPRPPQRRSSVADAAVQELGYIEANSKLERVTKMNEIDASSILVESKLGEGSFAMALKVKVRNSGSNDSGDDNQQYYAMKCLNTDTRSSDEDQVEKALEDLAVEADILSRIKHENIITLHGVASGPLLNSMKSSQWGYFLLLDILNDTLYDRLNQWRKTNTMQALSGKGRTSTAEVMKRLQLAGVGVAKGMSHLHEKNILIRDLKPENIGFDMNGTPKLFDFGFAREAHMIKSDEVAGSPRYMAPETFLGEGLATYSTDVYSFGLVLFEICTLQHPYNNNKRFSFGKNKELSEEDEDDLKFCWEPRVDMLGSRPLRRIISECCAFAPSARPDFATILETLESEVKKHQARKQLGGSSFTGKIGRNNSLKRGLLAVRSKSFQQSRRSRSESESINEEEL